MLIKSEEKVKLRDLVLKEFKKNRNNVIPIEWFRHLFFGQCDNNWYIFRQKLLIRWAITKIRNETNLNIYNIKTSDGKCGYKIIETKEEFKDLIFKKREMSRRILENTDKMERDMNSWHYQQRVERFYK